MTRIANDWPVWIVVDYRGVVCEVDVTARTKTLDLIDYYYRPGRALRLDDVVAKGGMSLREALVRRCGARHVRISRAKAKPHGP